MAEFSKAKGRPCSGSHVVKTFGKWNDALEAAELKPSKASKGKGKVPRSFICPECKKEFKEAFHGNKKTEDPCCSQSCAATCSAKKKKFEEGKTEDTEKKAIIDFLLDLGKKLGRSPVKEDYDKAEKRPCSGSHVVKLFGKWNTAIEAVGFQLTRSSPGERKTPRTFTCPNCKKEFQEQHHGLVKTEDPCCSHSCSTIWSAKKKRLEKNKKFEDGTYEKETREEIELRTKLFMPKYTENLEKLLREEKKVKKKPKKSPLKELVEELKKESGGCVRCGEKDIRFLDFSHVGVEKGPSVPNLTSEREIIAEAKKAVILCVFCRRMEMDSVQAAKKKSREDFEYTEEEDKEVDEKSSKECHGPLCNGKMRNLKNFGTNGGTPNFLCRNCHNYELNLSVRKKKAFKDAIKLAIGKCVDCGLQVTLERTCCFDFDHINPEDKDYGISLMKYVKFETIEEEIMKCRLLCAKCHRIRTYGYTA